MKWHWKISQRRRISLVLLNQNKPNPVFFWKYDVTDIFEGYLFYNVELFCLVFYRRNLWATQYYLFTSSFLVIFPFSSHLIINTTECENWVFVLWVLGVWTNIFIEVYKIIYTFQNISENVFHWRVNFQCKMA